MKTTVIAAFILTLLLPGCTKSPFSLRDAEDPIVEEGTYITPVDPDIALENLRYAMIERNLGNYKETFSDSFVFAYDYLLQGQPGDDRQWDLAEDLRIAASVFDGVDTVRLRWSLTPGRTDQTEDSTAVLYRTYTLTTITPDTAKEEFTGEMIVYLARNTLDLWWIVRWEDSHLTAESPSWADLKSRYQ